MSIDGMIDAIDGIRNSFYRYRRRAIDATFWITSLAILDVVVYKPDNKKRYPLVMYSCM